MVSEKQLHAMISFDMESDIGSWTAHHEGVAKATGPILEILDKHGIESTFFYTGNAAKAGPELVRTVRSAGHEIGCHTLFHESMGDPLIEIPEPPVLVEEIPNRLAKATDVVEKIAGVRPVTFRAPRGWASAEMMVALDELGYVADSSYMTWYFRKYFLPYHPSATDWTAEGDLSILEIPLLCDSKAATSEKIIREYDQWPMLRTQGADALADMVMGIADMLWARGEPAVACIYLHPWEFIEMPPVVQTDEAKIEFAEFLWRNTGDVALRELDKLIGLLKESGAQYHTVKGFQEVWTNQLQGACQGG